MRSATTWLAVLFALFHVYNNWFTAVSELWFAAIHFGGFGALCALNHGRNELHRDLQNATQRGASDAVLDVRTVLDTVRIV